MKESDAQTGADQGVEPLSTELTKRLLRRSTEPLGVIDVRHPQHAYGIARWAVQRFPLLEYLNRRYGGYEDAAANTELVLAAPARAFAEPSSTPPIGAPAAAKPPVAAPSGAGAATSSSSGQQFRVRRRSAPPIPPPHAPVLPEHGRFPMTERSDTPAIESRLEPSSMHMQRAVDPGKGEGNTPPVREGVAMPNRIEDVFLMTGPRILGEEGSISLHQDLPLKREELPGARPMTNPLRLSGSPGAQLVRGKHEPSLPPSRPGPGLDLTSPVAERTRSRVHTPLVQRKAADSEPLGQAEAVTGSAGEHLTLRAADIRASPLAQPVRPPHELPLRPSRPGPALDLTSPVAERPEAQIYVPLVQRQAADNDAIPQAEAVSGSPGEHPTSRAAEIRTASSASSKPAAVWRQRAKGPSAGEGATTANLKSALPLVVQPVSRREVQIARQPTVAESTVPSNAQGTQPAPATPSEATFKEIDIARLAEQVSRLLARQLAVERDRRGRG